MGRPQYCPFFGQLTKAQTGMPCEMHTYEHAQHLPSVRCKPKRPGWRAVAEEHFATLWLAVNCLIQVPGIPVLTLFTLLVPI